MGTRSDGPDPVDGLRLALLQQRAEQLRARLGFRKFGFMELLPLLMLACGITVLVTVGHGRYARIQHQVLGWALVVQAVGLWWSARHTAHKELQRLQLRISALAHSPDGAAIVAAATAARSVLLRKPR